LLGYRLAQVVKALSINPQIIILKPYPKVLPLGEDLGGVILNRVFKVRPSQRVTRERGSKSYYPQISLLNM
jgi:hypothetical protein